MATKRKDVGQEPKKLKPKLSKKASFKLQRRTLRVYEEVNGNLDDGALVKAACARHDVTITDAMPRMKGWRTRGRVPKPVEKLITKSALFSKQNDPDTDTESEDESDKKTCTDIASMEAEADVQVESDGEILIDVKDSDKNKPVAKPDEPSAKQDGRQKDANQDDDDKPERERDVAPSNKRVKLDPVCVSPAQPDECVRALRALRKLREFSKKQYRVAELQEQILVKQYRIAQLQKHTLALKDEWTKLTAQVDEEKKLYEPFIAWAADDTRKPVPASPVLSKYSILPGPASPDVRIPASPMPSGALQQM